MNWPTSNHLLQRVRDMLGGEAGACRLQVAALPWRKAGGKVEVLLITSRDTGRWVLPKGWPQPGEALWDSAAREANEEAGLSGKVSQSEAGRYFYAKVLPSGEEVPCEVMVYSLEVSKISGRWKEKDQRRRKWVSPAEAARMLNEPDLCLLITSFGVDPRRFAA